MEENELDATDENIRIGWIGLRHGIQERLSRFWSVLPLSIEDCNSNSNGIAALVVEEAVINSESCKTICERAKVPVLLVVDSKRTTEVCNWISDRDDVVLPDERMVDFRLRRLVSMTQRDPLTNLLCRRSIFDVIKRDVAGATMDSPHSILSLDLDHFKNVNDTWGHAAGDQVLCKVAEVVGSVCGTIAACGRTGGEEFTISIQGNEQTAAAFGEELRRAICDAEFPDEISMTVSIGIKTTTCVVSPEDICGQSCEALYAAKAAGRNCVVGFWELENEALRSGNDVSITGLETRTRVLTERIANFVSMRSRRVMELARREAETDGLTEFYTRRYLDRRLETEFKSNDNTKLTVALVDLDHFGVVNKEHGWPSGDRVLKDACQVISRELRESDWVGRYGGEEFCIVMPNTSVEEAHAVLERLRQAIERHEFRSTEDVPLKISASIGIVGRQKTDISPVTLLERASTETRRAKNAGRNQVCCA